MKLLIGIAGPAGGGKTTLAKRIVTLININKDFKGKALYAELSYPLVKAFDILPEHVQAVIGRREFCIAYGDMLRAKVGPNVIADCTNNYLQQRVPTVAIVSGLKDMNEWDRLCLSNLPLNKIIIQQDHYAVKTLVQDTEIGNIYHNDIRRNLSYHADFINPTLRTLKELIMPSLN